MLPRCEVVTGLRLGRDERCGRGASRSLAGRVDGRARPPVASAHNRRALIKSGRGTGPLKPRQPTDASRQGAKSGQVLLRDKGTPSEPPLPPGGLPVPGPEARQPRPGDRHADRDPHRRHAPDDRRRAADRASSAWAVATAALTQPIGAGLRLSGLFRAARGRLRLRGRRRRRSPARRSRAARPASGATSSCSRSRRRRRVACRSGRRRSLAADRLAPDPRRRPAVAQGRHPQPVAVSFKDRAVAVAAARAVEFGVEALACASTGNLAGATAAAAAAVGLPAYVFIPADLEPAKVDHALAYGATVVPDRRHLRRRQPPLPRGRRRDRLGLRQHQPAAVLRRGLQDARLRDRRVARLALAGRRRRAGRLGGDVHARRARLRGARRARASSSAGRSASSAARRPAAPRSRRPGRPARTSSSRSASPTRSSARWPSATRPTAATPSSWRARAAARSRPSRTRPPRRRSATSPGSRASTRRRPAA